jgi:DNA gyrase subunit B
MKEYGANSIEFLKGLETVRTRPTMYIGAVSGNPSDGLYRLFREALDNAIDEFLAGFNKNIWIFYNTKTKQTTVVDNGRGIPVGWNEKAQMDSLTLVFTQLHAGGKFNHDVYKTSSGLNGIGQKAIAALSTHLQVWSNNSKDNWFYTQTFEKGIVKSDVTRCRLPEEYKGLIKKKGTIVQWTPDPTIFTDSTDLDLPRLKRELKDIQYLCPGLHIYLKIDDHETIEYYSEKGLEELVSKNENDSIFTFSDEFTDVAVNFGKEDGYTFRSFVNVCYTNLGGTHLNGLKKTICNIVKENSKKKILNDDILEGVIGAIHHRMADPQYQGQTKNELTNTPVEKEIIEKLTPPMEKFFRRNKDVLNRIVTYAEKMFEQKEKMKASKDLLKGLKTLNASSKYISDKFLDADRRKHKNPKDLEMFIVEGDSAGGHFSRARESFQGELKIRGKIINAAKATPEELFGKATKKGEAKCEGNREIKDLVAALGCGIQDDYDESKLRFGKVILCTDSDTDGRTYL